MLPMQPGDTRLGEAWAQSPLRGLLAWQQCVVQRSFPLAPHRSRYPSRFAPFSQLRFHRESVSAATWPVRHLRTRTALL